MMQRSLDTARHTHTRMMCVCACACLRTDTLAPAMCPHAHMHGVTDTRAEAHMCTHARTHVHNRHHIQQASSSSHLHALWRTNDGTQHIPSSTAIPLRGVTDPGRRTPLAQRTSRVRGASRPPPAFHMPRGLRPSSSSQSSPSGGASLLLPGCWTAWAAAAAASPRGS